MVDDTWSVEEAIEHHGQSELPEQSSSSGRQTAWSDACEAVGPPVVTDVTLIESRHLIRDCFVEAMRVRLDFRLAAYSSVERWRSSKYYSYPQKILLLSLIGFVDAPQAVAELSDILGRKEKPAVVVYSDDEEPNHIVETLRLGVRGYIPTSLSLSNTASALKFVADGGTFVPASSLHFACQNQSTRRSDAKNALAEFFTPRQQVVVRALCQGKPNKIIAYELNMCESTVKVHIRNVMKKLKAKNRTEVVIMAQKLSDAGEHANGSGDFDLVSS